MGRRLETVSPEQVFYAAACGYAERVGVQPRYVELFRDDLADPEAVDRLADRDPGFRVALDDVPDAVAYLTRLAAATRLAHVWAQVADQLPTPHVLVPVRGTIQ
ncbi:MAG TPA: hypothetical protein VG370_24340 [Chloroflexota bacterium]|nr:hypothetical protein [Chloroflexota bacterium]